MISNEKCEIRAQNQLAQGIFRLVVHVPRITRQVRVGQFVHLACGEGNLLRRPISVCDWTEDELQLVYQVKGAGTRWLSEQRAGQTVDILGPLGNGFTVSALGQRPMLIGGGIGVPPMLATMRETRGAGATPTAILGFRTGASVILEKEFAALGQTIVVTDDGSYGQHGQVTAPMSAQLAQATGIAACGPRPMLRAIATLAQQAGIPCQVSLEERMGCGIGACLVCACALQGKDGQTRYGHVCKDGPVFWAQEVAW